MDDRVFRRYRQRQLLFTSTLQQSIAGHFAKIEARMDLGEVAVAQISSGTVMIVDAPDPGKTVALLQRLAAGADLSRTIILMRGNQCVTQFLPILGRVGAILPNDCTVQDVALVARVVRRGLFLLPAEMLSARTLNASLVCPPDKDGDALTGRERNVLALVAEGAANKVIARKLAISDSTVRVHVRSILKKLGLQNRTQAALYALGSRHVELAPTGDRLAAA